MAELGERIRVALASGDADAIDAWAEYLAHEARALAPLAQACRAAEARIRAACAAERERTQRQAA